MLYIPFPGRFKRATVGKCSDKGGSQPWAVQMEARAKWDAWAALNDTDVETAKKEYVDKLKEITKDQGDKKFDPK